MKNNWNLQEEKIKLEHVEMDRKANEDKLKVIFICEYWLKYLFIDCDKQICFRNQFYDIHNISIITNFIMYIYYLQSMVSVQLEILCHEYFISLLIEMPSFT